MKNIPFNNNDRDYNCQMGPPTNPWAVVDPQLRVYGIKGLRVIDASIMPTITSGNIHAPVVMIGEKGADLVKELWLQDEAVARIERAANETIANGTIANDTSTAN